MRKGKKRGRNTGTVRCWKSFKSKNRKSNVTDKERREDFKDSFDKKQIQVSKMNYVWTQVEHWRYISGYRIVRNGAPGNTSLLTKTDLHSKAKVVGIHPSIIIFHPKSSHGCRSLRRILWPMFLASLVASWGIPKPDTSCNLPVSLDSF